MDGLLDIFKDSPSLPDGRDNGGEIIIHQDHVGGIFRHIGSVLSHGAANVCRFQGRGVVYPVSGHGHYISLLLVLFYQTYLVGGGDSGKDAVPGQAGCQFAVRQKIQLPPGENLFFIAADPQLLSNGGGSDPVVSGDHYRLYAGILAASDGGKGFLPGRIHKSGESREDQLLFQGGVFVRGVGQAVTHCQYPQCIGGKFFGLGE